MKNYSKNYHVLALLLLITITFFSCEDESFVPEQENVANNSQQKLNVIEQAYPNSKGEIGTIQLNGESVEVEKINDEYVLGGDMIVIPDNISAYDKSTGRTQARWPRGIVYYAIESGLPNQKRVIDAMAHWENNTSVRFIKRTFETAYVNFRKGSGCSSNVGRTGGKQNITLADGCSTGNTIHEIGHAVGLWHEQSRKDQNNFITVNFNNIQAGKEHNFRTYVARGFDGNEFTTSLDFGSIMMYGPTAFSKNGQPTITKKNGSLYSTQRNGLSNGDKQGIVKMYPESTIITISFKANTGRYINSKNGSEPLALNASNPGLFERYQLVKLNNGKVAFKGNNGKYISSENGNKKMICNRSAIGAWEQFALISKGGKTYNIKGNNGKYVSSNGGDTRGVTCDRTNAGSYELFTISGL